MPKLWTNTVETHRQEVRSAILDAAGDLVHDQGLLAVTMSQLAEVTGIGRATLYKYFPGAKEVLAAWHQRHVAAHLAELTALRERSGSPAERLRAVLLAYGRICRERHHYGGNEMAADLHSGDQVAQLQDQLLALFASLVTEAAATGLVREDLPAEELARYCIHALGAADKLASPEAQGRLVDLVWAGLTTHQSPSE